MADANYMFVVCQVGAEAACKTELAAHHPELKFAFSRPGFLTFKISGPTSVGAVESTNDEASSDDGPATLLSTFARTFGHSLGRVTGTDAVEMIAQAIKLAGDKQFDQLHVWQRDAALPGDRGFEPFTTPLAEEIGMLIQRELKKRGKGSCELNQIAEPGQKVLDVILVEPNEWWVGWHAADSVHQRWPGGVPEIEDNGDVISRAYYKLAEALAWGRIKIEKQDLCVEIGSAPGGAAQLLLEKGALVIAVDPANLHESLSKHENLKHIKKRGRQVRKAEFAEARWLMVDVNVAPKFTLDTAEEIVQNARVNIRGMVLTLKMTDSKLAEHITGYRERVRSWGYKVVKTRQLAFNRHEICLVALKTRYDSRPKPMLKKDETTAKNEATRTDSKRSPKKKPSPKPSRPFKKT